MKDYSIRIYLEDILFIESQLRHVKIHTKNKKYLIKNISIKRVLERIGNKNFLRIHRSYIINMNNIEKIKKEGNEPWEIRFMDYDGVAYVSQTYKDSFTNKFEEYKKRCEAI